jgi:hypothetical protein
MSPECSLASTRGANQKQITTTHPQRDNIFSSPLCPAIELLNPMSSSEGTRVRGRAVTSKIELADSRIETKLPMKAAELLHLY